MSFLVSILIIYINLLFNYMINLLILCDINDQKIFIKVNEFRSELYIKVYINIFKYLAVDTLNIIFIIKNII